MPRLLHLTDPHLKPHPTDTLVGIYPDLNLQAVLEQAHRDSGPFDLILITGDLAQDPCPASYQRLSELLSSYPCPTLCLPGNHDDLALMRDILNQAPVSCVSPMTLAGWQIVCINTQKPQASQGWVSPAEMAHLRAALHTKQPTLIAMHHHCLSTGRSWMGPPASTPDAVLRVSCRTDSHIPICAARG